MDETASLNERHWERMVSEHCDFAQPWLNLNQGLLFRYAAGELPQAPEPLTEMYPPSILCDVAGKQVLCLASGGGQQSAVFALLGAQVTVVDLSAGQLAGDRAAAAHYGYTITILHADMRDLSALPARAFDLVYQAPSMCYVPRASEVYAQVTRLLRPGGRYRVSITHPAVEFVDMEDWDGIGYRITRPYGVGSRVRPDGALEYRHYMADALGGLLANGLELVEVCDAPEMIALEPEVEPGSWEHYGRFVGGFYMVAIKRPTAG